MFRSSLVEEDHALLQGFTLLRLLLSIQPSCYQSCISTENNRILFCLHYLSWTDSISLVFTCQFQWHCNFSLSRSLKYFSRTIVSLRSTQSFRLVVSKRLVDSSVLVQLGSNVVPSFFQSSCVVFHIRQA